MNKPTAAQIIQAVIDVLVVIGMALLAILK